jgi:S-(hydroxymethyl)glutathione dehydrogenase/alcohol dehydrogenase
MQDNDSERTEITTLAGGVYGSAYDQFPLGLLFNRNLQIKMGQCPVKKYNEQLLHLIEAK